MNKKTHGTMISMSRALLWLLSILYTHEQSRNFNIRLPWSYQAKVWILYACVQAIDVEKKEPFIKYYKLQYIYRSCVSLFAYVHCLRCACGPMVVFFSFIFCASFLGVLLLLLRFLFVDGGISGLRGLFSFPMEKQFGSF